MVAGLNARQKAAVVVRVLLQDERDLSLEALPPEVQAALVRELAGMDMIDRATRDRVVAEFCDTLEQVGVTFPEGLNKALALLGGRISADCADRLRRVAALSGDGDPWDRLLSLPVGPLVDLATSEAVEVAAVLFSRLPPARAAEVLALLPAARARRIAHAMSLTGGVEAAALRRIGLALVQAVEAMPRPALAGAPAEKVGAILNHASPAMREEVLTGLDAEDRSFAAHVRRNIFTWANIPARVAARDTPRVLRQLDQAALAKALAGATAPDDAAVVDYILASVPSRMADALRDEVEMLGTVPAAQAEAGMAAAVAAIRELEAAGDITLLVPEADDG